MLATAIVIYAFVNVLVAGAIVSKIFDEIAAETYDDASTGGDIVTIVVTVLFGSFFVAYLLLRSIVRALWRRDQ